METSPLACVPTAADPRIAGTRPSSVLMARAGACVCALPISDVLEILRPLPVQPLGNLPPFVLGLAVIRGGPVPVVDLGSVLGLEKRSALTRFVTVRVADRKVALAVEGVIGVRRLDASLLEQAPSLLEGACRDLIETIGARDEGLLFVLRSSRIIPPELWRALEGSGDSA